MTYRSIRLPRGLELVALAVLGTVGLASCTSTPELEPAAGAQRLSGAPVGAEASAQGVHVEAAVEAWNGKPETLEQLEPVLVTIYNRSDQPLQLRYKEFQLVSADGTRYRALPPLSIDQEATVVRENNFSPYYGSDFGGFSAAPNWGSYYGGYGGVYSGFGYDRGYYDTYDLKDIQLPTEDMVERALPEGVLEPGGKAKGFLYFEQLKSSAKKAQLRTELVNPETGEQFGRLSIPFTVS